jgi:hypothetical protein
VLIVITGMADIPAGAVANEPQLAAIAKLIDGAATRGAALTAHLLSSRASKSFCRHVPAARHG